AGRLSEGLAKAAKWPLSGGTDGREKNVWYFAENRFQGHLKQSVTLRCSSAGTGPERQGKLRLSSFSPARRGQRAPGPRQGRVSMPGSNRWRGRPVRLRLAGFQGRQDKRLSRFRRLRLFGDSSRQKRPFPPEANNLIL